MLNTAREVNKMIFIMDADSELGGITIKSGLNVINRANKQYQISHVSQINNPYAVLPDKYMHKLLKIVFYGMANGGFMHDEDDDNEATGKVIPFPPSVLKQA